MQRATVTYWNFLSTLPYSKCRLQIKKIGPKSMHGTNQLVQISDVLIIQDCKDDQCIWIDVICIETAFDACLYQKA